MNDAKKLPILDADRKYSTKPKKRHNIVGYRFLFCQENIFFFKYVKITILIFKVFKKRFSNKDKRTNETLNKLANNNHLSKKKA